MPFEDGEIFHADWERRAFVVSQFAQVVSGFNTDAFRHGIERSPRADYLASSYFGRWVENAERMLVEGGVLGADVVDSRLAGVQPSAVPGRTTDALPPLGRGSEREATRPARFSVGALVRTLDHAPNRGHHRLPAYVQGHAGRVSASRGVWVFPDTHAHGRGEDSQWVYAVRFRSADLWSDRKKVDIGPDDAVILDLFEPYLEPA